MSTVHKTRQLTMAEQADRHLLYQASVQNPDFELDFIDDTFKRIRGRKPRSMREDFAGTAISSCRWVKRRRSNTSIAVDFDPEVLAWSKVNNISKLSEEQKQRIELIEDDVLNVTTEKVDVLQAYNFSYWFFQERATMLNYFRRTPSSPFFDF